MAIGDFVLMQSHGDLDIQIRLQPYQGQTSAAVTTGIAVRNGGDRLEWRLEGQQLIVNGAARQLNRGAAIRLRSHGVLRHDGDGFLFLSSGGDQLRVEFHAASVDYSLYAARPRQGTLRGLFGNVDGDPGNDLRSASGELASHYPGEPPDYQRPLYRRFGESWRVAAGRSLFSTPYAPPTGVDVATFPRPLPPPADDARAAATAACRAGGVTDAVVLEACVFAYVQSGGPSFIASAARANREIRDGVRSLWAVRSSSSVMSRAGSKARRSRPCTRSLYRCPRADPRLPAATGAWEVRLRAGVGWRPLVEPDRPRRPRAIRRQPACVHGARRRARDHHRRNLHTVGCWA